MPVALKRPGIFRPEDSMAIQKRNVLEFAESKTRDSVVIGLYLNTKTYYNIDQKFFVLL